MKQISIQGIKVGDTAEIKHRISEEDVALFAKLTGDTNPLHMDEKYAKGTSFHGRVVHGMLTASFLSTLIGTKLPGAGALWYEQSFRFLSPVRIGEEIKVVGRVTSISLSQQVLSLNTTIYNQKNEPVIEGEGKVKITNNTEKNSVVSQEPSFDEFNVHIATPQKEAVRPKKQTSEETNAGAIIVTGSSKGIGQACAIKLAADGHPVVINFHSDSSKENVSEIIMRIHKNGGNAISCQADVTKEEDIEKLIFTTLKQYHKIKGLVNSVALGPVVKEFKDLGWNDLQHYFEYQIKSSFLACKAVLPCLYEIGYGNIVNIGSIVTDMPAEKWMPYNVAKGALISFTKSLALEVGPKSIRVNAVSPGMTDTEMISNLSERARLISKMRTPLRRLGEPEDIANVVSFLFSDKARYITGQNIRVCGGQIMF